MSDDYNGNGTHVWEEVVMGDKAEWSDDGLLVKIPRETRLLQVCEDTNAAMKSGVGKSSQSFTVLKVDHEAGTMLEIGGWTYLEKTTLPEGTFGYHQQLKDPEDYLEINGWTVAPSFPEAQLAILADGDVLVKYSMEWALDQFAIAAQNDKSAARELGDRLFSTYEEELDDKSSAREEELSDKSSAREEELSDISSGREETPGARNKEMVQWLLGNESFDPTSGISVHFLRPPQAQLDPLCPICTPPQQDNTMKKIEEARDFFGNGATFAPPKSIPVVQVVVNFSKLVRVDTIGQTFGCAFSYTMSWPVTRIDVISFVATPEEERIKWKPVFMPSRLEVGNPSDGDSDPPKVVPGPCKLLVEAGEVVAQMTVTVSGTFHEAFELESYPFDVQPLTITLQLPVGIQAAHTFQVLPNGDPCKINTTEWLWKRNFATSSGDGGISCGLVVAREFFVHVYRIMIMMALFAVIPLAGFSLEAEDSTSDRLGLAVTMLLTATAYSLVISASLPTLGYLTLLDQHILSVLFFTLLVTFQFTIVKYFDLPAAVDKAFLYTDATLVVGMHVCLCVYVRFVVYPKEQVKATSNSTSEPGSCEEQTTRRGRMPARAVC